MAFLRPGAARAPDDAGDHHLSVRDRLAQLVGLGQYGEHRPGVVSPLRVCAAAQSTFSPRRRRARRLVSGPLSSQQICSGRHIRSEIRIFLLDQIRTRVDRRPPPRRARSSADMGGDGNGDRGSDVDQGRGGVMGGFGKPALAMLGGFSSAVIYWVINQLITAVESLVRGEKGDIIASREQAAKARANEEIGRNRLKLAGNLMSLQQQLGAEASPEQMNRKLGQLLGELMPSGVTGEVTLQTSRKQATQARADEEIDPKSAPASTEFKEPPVRTAEETTSDREKVGNAGD